MLINLVCDHLCRQCVSNGSYEQPGMGHVTRDTWLAGEVRSKKRE